MKINHLNQLSFCFEGHLATYAVSFVCRDSFHTVFTLGTIEAESAQQAKKNAINQFPKLANKTGRFTAVPA